MLDVLQVRRRFRAGVAGRCSLTLQSLPQDYLSYRTWTYERLDGSVRSEEVHPAAFRSGVLT
jgi:hypothetical protein